jgi:colicin import membrane protein
MSEADGANEFVEGGLRVAVTAAGMLAERAARAREERARQAQAGSVAEARELQARLEAERAAARAYLAQVEQDGWWPQARVEDVAQAWETAQTWHDADPDVARAADRIRREVRDRYGIDVDDARPDRDALERALVERQRADEERRRAEGVREELEAAAVLAAAEPGVAAECQVDQERAELTAALVGVEDHESVEARLLADVHQGARRRRQ